MRRLLLVAPSCALLVACGSPPAPVPVVSPPPSASAPVAVAPPPPARWVETGSFNDVGTKTTDGTPLIVGGRRAVLAADGAFKVPAVATPEPLEELVEVTTSAGKKLVARGERTLYRIDDLLGEAKPIAHSPTGYTNIDSGPGVVAAWTTSSELPAFVDVESGNVAPLAGLPVAPLRSVAFVDMKQGAGVFAALGLATTTDGGASWHAVSDPGGGAFNTKLVAARDGGLVAIRNDEAVHQIDAGAATIGPEAPHVLEPGDAPPIVRWIARTHRDPLEAAITSGIVTRGGAALAVSRGYVARVDLATGAILELVDLGSEIQSESCSIARSGDTAFVACGAFGVATAKVNVFSIALGTSALVADKPIVVGTTSLLRSSPSGGVMLAGPCRKGNDGYACVRQPDGTWATIDAPLEHDGSSTFDRQSGTPISYGIGPLADGGVAYLAPYHDDEDPSATASAAPAPRANYEHGKLRVVVIERSGMHRKMPAIEYDDPAGALRVLGTIEEDETHTLRIVVADDTGPIVIAQGPTGAASARRVDGVTAARVHGMRGIALGTRRLLASTDGGGTWAELPTPPHVFASLGSGFGGESDAWKFVLGDNGARLAGHLRIGWGDLDPNEMSRATPSNDDRGHGGAPPPAPPPHLTCTTVGASTSTPNVTTSAELDKAFGISPPPKGTRRNTARWSSSAIAAGVTRIVLEIEGPEKAPHPTTWRLHWINLEEVGARPRSWSGAAPKDSSWSPSIRNGASAGDRFFAVVVDAGHEYLTRTAASGAMETVALPNASLAVGQVSIGARAGDPAAWWRSTFLVAVPSGALPETIGAIGADMRAIVWIGAPTKDGVPVYVGTNQWAMTRTYPLPAVVKGAPPSPPQPGDPIPKAVLDGWTSVAVRPRTATSLPVCTAKSTGGEFDLDENAYMLSVDGATENGYSTRAHVRIGATDACVSGLVTTFRGFTTPRPAADPKKPKKPGGPVAFLRADLVGKRAEGGGDPSSGDVRRLDCTLTPR